MPELPEVETMVRTLRPHVEGRTFGPPTVLRDSAIGLPDPSDFCRLLTGQSAVAVSRRGKYILITLGAGGLLIVHLRMTGQIAFFAPDTAPAPHTRVVIPLDSGQDLHYIDQRTFGKLYLLPDSDVSRLEGLATLGPEPLAAAFTTAGFRQALGRTSRPIKSALLDQTVVAGIGNIYADEALFRAAIHPATPARSLRPAQTRRLHEAIRQVLSDGIAHRGTTFRHFRNAEGEQGGHQAHLAVYGRSGEPCPTCGESLQRLVLSGRSSHFCPHCQPQIS